MDIPKRQRERKRKEVEPDGGAWRESDERNMQKNAK